MQPLKQNITAAFSLHGYNLRKEAVKFLEEHLQLLTGSQRQKELHDIINHIHKQNLTSTLLEKTSVETAITTLQSASNNDELLFKVFDAFSLIRFTYNIDSKKFLPWSSVHEQVSRLHGQADSKTDMLVEKYKAIKQRTARHELFASPAFGSSSTSSEAFPLKSVENLLGVPFKENKAIVLGMLTQLTEGQFHLEDPTGCVKLNLSKTTYKGGLFTENNIVLVEGVYEDKVFHASTIGFPPPEPASITLSHFPNFCVTPYPAINSHRLSPTLKLAEESNRDAMFVFLSDVWLDQLKVMQKLHTLFTGYSQMPPTCFVFIGNFLSLSVVGSYSKSFEEYFSQLGNLISEFPTLLESSQFIFVPGPNDPGLPYILPRPSIPPSFLGDFMKKVPKAHFTSNPCRIQYCTQDILIFREDAISKVCRNSIYTPWQKKEKVDIPNLFVKTIIANSHLLPLPPNVVPVYWEYDYAMWLYPLPDVVVCADKYDPYIIKNAGSLFFNPGSLPRSNFAFKVYYPSQKEVEDSEIMDDIST